MGECCSNERGNKGENAITEVLGDQRFLLNKIKIEKFKSVLLSFPPKSYENIIELQKNLYPHLFDNSKKNKIRNIHKDIIDEIFFKISNNSSVEATLFYLYPFMDHQGENVMVNIYKIFKEKDSDVMNYEHLRELLEDYIDNCTIKLTFAMWNSCRDKELKKSLDELNSVVYTNEHLSKIVDKMMERIKSKKGEIAFDEFNASLVDYGIENYRSIRNLFNFEYGEK